jgi:hypothetical protein
MTLFMTWLSNPWDTPKKVGSKLGSFIGKENPILRTLCNARNYLPSKWVKSANLLTITKE